MARFAISVTIASQDAFTVACCTYYQSELTQQSVRLIFVKFQIATSVEYTLFSLGLFAFSFLIHGTIFVGDKRDAGLCVRIHGTTFH